MYEHIVVFKFRTELPAAQEESLLTQLRSFQGRIPGIVSMSAGRNVTHETENIHGFTIGLRITFEDHAALMAYGPHPAHQAFVASLDGLVDQVVVVDYEIGKETSRA
ncbi:Dabb family protein [Paenibacillus antri]|uniref:Dabb family protein n=1 Tax=Paenibacillus antri TaxID=2582848 RepID=A0A5R9G7D8_9BACL|nr:Dabb family protein [Paenibacillus antri]TLS52327.1 Dabb family protein [Paenibacillus antri]